MTALRKVAVLGGICLLIWIGIRFVLPVAAPFLLGAVLAFAAEPMTALASGRLRISRPLAAGISVSLALGFFLTILTLLGSFAVKELAALAGALPGLVDTISQGMNVLQGFLEGLAERAPEGLRLPLTNALDKLFGSGGMWLSQLALRVPGMATRFLGGVPDGALAVGTGILSAYMISARLPQIRAFLKERMPEKLIARYLPLVRKLKKAVGGWLKAQVKLSGVSCLILLVGFLLLRVPYAPVWALAVSMVDALPLLGAGTVLLPWALISLLQGRGLFALGLLGVFLTTALTRSALEPRLVGRQLGVDPLVTLVALYMGFHFWGFWGMILSPMLALLATELAAAAQ